MVGERSDRAGPDDRDDATDSIALGLLPPRFATAFRRVLLANGDVATEGGVGGTVTPYEIAYRSLVPKRAECTNLLVPQCMAATNVAWTSIRMEPGLMMMGHRPAWPRR